MEKKMKKQIITFLAFLVLGACNSNDYIPKYKDFANAWEREFLIGKVKCIEQYKANVSNLETGETQEPVLAFKKEFNDSGNILSLEYFDFFGKSRQSIKNFYDRNGCKIKSISENYEMSSKSIENSIFDTITKKQIATNVVFDDTLFFDAFYKYDKQGNLIEQTEIQNGDTTLHNFENEYANDGQILLTKQIVNHHIENIRKFKYNSDGNLIEWSDNSESFEDMKLIYDYDRSKRIEKITEYKFGHLTKETSFDKNHNMTSVCFYVNNDLNREMRYEYEFDKLGNWIKREVFMKVYSGDKKTKPLFIETREIEYFK